MCACPAQPPLKFASSRGRGRGTRAFRGQPRGQFRPRGAQAGSSYPWRGGGRGSFSETVKVPGRSRGRGGQYHNQAFDRNSNPKDSQKVIDFLRHNPGPKRAIDISRACGYDTKKSINPTLYNLLEEGHIEKASLSPLTWQLDDRDVLGNDLHFSLASVRQELPYHNQNDFNLKGSDVDKSDSEPHGEGQYWTNGAGGSLEDFSGKDSRDASITMRRGSGNRFSSNSNPTNRPWGQSLMGPFPSNSFQARGFPGNDPSFLMKGPVHPINGPAHLGGGGFSGPNLRPSLGRAQSLVKASFGPGMWRSEGGGSQSGRGTYQRGAGRGFYRNDAGQNFSAEQRSTALQGGSHKEYHAVKNRSKDAFCKGDHSSVPTHTPESSSGSHHQSTSLPPDRSRSEAFRKSWHDKNAPGAYVPKPKVSVVASAVNRRSNIKVDFSKLSLTLHAVTRHSGWEDEVEENTYGHISDSSEDEEYLPEEERRKRYAQAEKVCYNRMVKSDSYGSFKTILSEIVDNVMNRISIAAEDPSLSSTAASSCHGGDGASTDVSLMGSPIQSNRGRKRK
ncbi:hypothetical protein PoB_000282300 [Plakobranchus ocellatus]|uniref:Z-binding domain-containing protein n=1 Tax=Plakobranchus ocellatus TaxID=259542 RepID=A0AAV3Y1T8_9GAST|nr:hypothetical protein PoB_000282300 [Plakobranchus ocellatus]